MTKFHHPQPLTDDHIAILEQAKQDILQEYTTHNMICFVHAECNTPSCVAGWISFRQKEWSKRADTNIAQAEEFANLALGVAVLDSCPLFFFSIHTDSCWEKDLENEYLDHPVYSLERAQVTAKAIDLYIANTRAHFANESEA